MTLADTGDRVGHGKCCTFALCEVGRLAPGGQPNEPLTNVIEDDYDGEFRYDRPPIGVLQGLDPNHVVYGGMAAKILAPGVRLGWLTLPQSLLEPAIEIRNVADRSIGVFDQIALAELIESGDLDRHVRAMRREYRHRRDAIVSAVTRAAPGLSVRGTDAGLHAVLEVPSQLTERELLSMAERRSIGLHGLACYRHGNYAGPEALVIGFGTPAAHEFATCVQAMSSLLTQAWQKGGLLDRATTVAAHQPRAV